MLFSNGIHQPFLNILANNMSWARLPWQFLLLSCYYAINGFNLYENGDIRGGLIKRLGSVGLKRIWCNTQNEWLHRHLIQSQLAQTQPNWQTLGSGFTFLHNPAKRTMNHSPRNRMRSTVDLLLVANIDLHRTTQASTEYDRVLQTKQIQKDT